MQDSIDKMTLVLHCAESLRSNTKKNLDLIAVAMRDIDVKIAEFIQEAYNLSPPKHECITNSTGKQELVGASTENQGAHEDSDSTITAAKIELPCLLVQHEVSNKTGVKGAEGSGDQSDDNGGSSFVGYEEQFQGFPDEIILFRSLADVCTSLESKWRFHLSYFALA